ncbi:RNA-binding protein [Mergibacter septicus]|uniref:RNA-binding protein n=1 Tax=Mergibacter septicus TaxID=221402 RepID=A0A8D4LIP6_9PAST|nr:S1 RNA-binding domain-containing protein [Mergibacter septicus]AWX14725.1 RNA-binding protein [Mergibacter septicus]QDJ13976.1 RNA-binding protein [Mergibacter septicus]UTU48575.1 S1 RNA-binding domain-containing protein [Mergibacter septicus]WMR95795.1 S1 RNA-binding domain-containing protein [Mergibacter septicus]
MNNKPLDIDVQHIENESDVEQKFIMPMLLKEHPYGLSIPAKNIKTKQSIPSSRIGKGSDKKYYVPDYIVTSKAYPVLVIEAKSPKEELNEGWREARLYAHELNSKYGEINPVKYVMATNGKIIWYGTPDNSNPKGIIEVNDYLYNSDFHEMIKFISFSQIENYTQTLINKLKPKIFTQARKVVGGSSIQNEEIPKNQFGLSISDSFGKIFNPESIDDRRYIVEKGYISSKLNKRSMEDIDKVVKAAKLPSTQDGIELINLSEPNEFKEQIGKNINKNLFPNKVMLIIGGVGSGKTTFIDHLQFVSIPKNKTINDNLVWLRLNLNNAPLSKDLVYNWIIKQFIESIKSNHPKIDFDELATKMKIFSVEVNKFKKGEGELLKGDEKTYNKELYKIIRECSSDENKLFTAYYRYFVTEKQKSLIIVFDNCDKRLKDEQLFMFDVSQWVKDTFKALVLLPLRDETYDNHKNTPPLDTVIKDNIFRIYSPSFKEILISRIQLSIGKIKHTGKIYSYNISNGMHINYPAEDQARYLVCILRSIMNEENNIRRLITGLSGSNIRKALEIFMDFCCSGHLSEDIILSMKTNPNYKLPYYIASRVLLRLNRRFYDSEKSYIKNVFDAKDPENPFYFSRLIILRFLHNAMKASETPSINKMKGYISINNTLDFLNNFGLSKNIALSEIEYLIKSNCILTEDFRESDIDENMLIKLAPAGFVHLYLLSDISYLAAVAEDLHFTDERVVNNIKSNIRCYNDQLSFANTLTNSKLLMDFLSEERKRKLDYLATFEKDSEYDRYSELKDCEDRISNLLNSSSKEPWKSFLSKTPIGKTIMGKVVKKLEYGYLIYLDEWGVNGLLHNSNIHTDSNKLDINAKINVHIDDCDPMRERISLTII